MMHDLLDIKFDKFVEDFNLKDDSREANWKRFVNYHYFSQFQPGRLDTDADLLDQICVDSLKFPQVHGAFSLLNDQIVSEQQDIDDILQKDQKGLLELYFVTFDKIDSLIPQLEIFFRDLELLENRESWINIAAYAMSQKVALKWKDNPKLRVVYYGDDGNDTKVQFEDSLRSCFSDIDIIRIDRKHLLDIINSNENSYQAAMEWKQAFLISGGNEKLGSAHIACMSAGELVKLLTTSDGLLRRNMFDDNVRDWQGNSAVNQEILATLKTYPERFVLFNNGITIVCKNVKLEHGKYVLENPQIVNGCQTCNMIYQAYREGVNLDDVQVIAKIVGSNEEVTQGIVRGANRQNIVYEEAFETIKAFHKKLESYFENNQVAGYQKIYYERRARQYANNVQIKPQQKISFRGLIQSMVALFLNHVEDSHKHEYTLLKSYKDDLFIDTHSCQPYYLAALLYLNVDILFRVKKLSKELSSYKMHIALLIKEMQGGLSPDLISDEIAPYCEQLLEILQDSSFEQCALEACKKFEEIRANWISVKGEQYKYGIKDSTEFRIFLMKEIYGAWEDHDAEKLYFGTVLSIKSDRYDHLYGFIQHFPDNIFCHVFDNPGIDPSYVGKKVSFNIILGDNNRKRAVNVQLME